MPEPRVSVLVVAKDEEHNLGACLRSVAWAFERIVVVDASSRDGTLEVALREADKAAVRAFDDFASQRNFALALAEGDWVLAIDADERATPALEAEIRACLADAPAAIGGYRVPIASVVLRRRFGYSGTQHDRPLRLFRRDRGEWTGLVHETVALNGECRTLESALEHHTLPDAHVFLEKINRYTDLEARALADSGRRFRLRDVLVRPAWVFVKLYLGKQGFRDGLEGLAFCLFSAVSAFVRAWKHRELEHARAATHAPELGVHRSAIVLSAQPGRAA